MFKSTAEFEKAMHFILTNFRDGQTDIEKIGNESGLEQTDFNDAVVKAIEMKLVTGLHAQHTIGGIFFSLANPRITYEGLGFIERFEQKQK